MSYNKKTWAKANKITSADLNRIEDGIAASDTAVSDLQTRTTSAEAAITDLQTETGDLGSYFVPANRVTTGGVVNLPIKHGELFICDNTLYRWRAPDRSGTGTYSFLASQVLAVTMSTYDVGSGSGSHVEGYYGNTSGGNTATGAYSHAEGMSTTASGYASHAEGRLSEASAESSHAEGSATLATSDGSHAEGGSTQATGENSHAEGASTQATGTGSHAEGGTTRATGNYAHAEGTNNATASAMASHAEGGSTTASGNYSHAEGYGTIANHKSQHVFGEYNAEDGSSAANTARGDYIEIVGRGNGPTTRANARTLDWSGNEVLAGKLQTAGVEIPNTQKNKTLVINTTLIQDGADGNNYPYINIGQAAGIKIGWEEEDPVSGESTFRDAYLSISELAALKTVSGKADNVPSTDEIALIRTLIGTPGWQQEEEPAVEPATGGGSGGDEEPAVVEEPTTGGGSGNNEDPTVEPPAEEAEEPAVTP